MSGHSKWSKVKHQKAVTDVVKSKLFTKAARAIAIAVREGGGIADPGANFRLRLAVEKAREVNMPKENIERAIAKGKGEGGESFEEVIYEAYGPFGVALFIEGATDNRQRTAATIKNALDQHGGTLAGPGAVAYLFQRVGYMSIEKSAHSYDAVVEAAVEGGADDVQQTDEVFEVYTKPALLSQVKEALSGSGFAVLSMELRMIPATSVALTDQEWQKVDLLQHQLLDLDDVQKVYMNA